MFNMGICGNIKIKDNVTINDPLIYDNTTHHTFVLIQQVGRIIHMVNINLDGKLSATNINASGTITSDLITTTGDITSGNSIIAQNASIANSLTVPYGNINTTANIGRLRVSINSVLEGSTTLNGNLVYGGTTHHTFYPVQNGGGIGQTTNKVYLGWNATIGRAKITIDSTDLGGIPTILDYGTSGNWTYYKFYDGLAICYGSFNYSGSSSLQYGPYLYALVCNSTDYPFAFKTFPCVFRTPLINNNYGCWISAWEDTTTLTNAGNFALLRPSIESLNVSVKVFAIGKWK